MGVFVNFSNHPSSKWPKEQLDAANEFGEIIDVSFPAVDPDTTTEGVHKLAIEMTDKILEFQPKVVMAMGEFTLTYSVISMLKEKGVRVLSACTVRDKQETVKNDGIVENVSVFRFVRFREY